MFPSFNLIDMDWSLPPFSRLRVEGLRNVSKSTKKNSVKDIYSLFSPLVRTGVGGRISRIGVIVSTTVNPHPFPFKGTLESHIGKRLSLKKSHFRDYTNVN